MNQTKNDFLNNNDIEKTHMILSIIHKHVELHQYCFTQNDLKLFLYKKLKFISVKVNDEYECPADVFRELPCQICEFLFLELPCCMKRVRKSKELEVCCIIFKTHHARCRFVHGFFTASSTTKCGIDLEVNCHWLKN